MLSTTGNLKFKYWLVVPIAIAAVAGVWLAADGRHHGDEPTYLYAGVYQTTEQIIAGEVQPSGISDFTQGRILHALLVKGVMTATGSGEAGFRAMVAINLALVVVSLALLFRMLRDLLPDIPGRRAALALLAMTPVILYMSFKVLADNEGLFAALVATYAMLRFARGGSAFLAAIAIIGLSVTALSKNHMMVLPASFWAAMCIVPIAGIDRRRIAVFGVACGIAGFLLTFAILEWLGVGLKAYLSSYGTLNRVNVSLVHKILGISTEFGVVWLLLPFAFLTSRRRELHAFGLWFLFAIAPFVLFIDSIEARHIAVNLVAAGGLFALAFEAIGIRVRAWTNLTYKSRCAISVFAVLVIMVSNSFMLAVMTHRVDLDQLHAMLAMLDRRYGAGRYALLTAAGYTDFQIVRVLWPDVDVRDVSTATIAVRKGRRSRKQALDSYLGDRYHDSIEELRTLHRPLIYVGYPRRFAAVNLRPMLSFISPRLADGLLGKVDLNDRLYLPATRWLWQSPDVRLQPLAQVGHYRAFEVQIRPEGATVGPADAR